MSRAPGAGRHFLFLQGPHGPFFRQLARALERTGARCSAVAFNAGDEAFWRPLPGLIRFDGPVQEWPAALEEIIAGRGITDLALYGDTRPIHAAGVRIARRRGLALHVFEEGYLRPNWISYERGGSNANSPLMRLSLEKMRAALPAGAPPMERPPGHWGDLRAHVFYGALYHALLMAGAGRYRHYRSHRDIPVRREALLQIRRLALMPALWLERALSTRRILQGGFPFSLVLLQLAHDASFRDHSPYESQEAFIGDVIEAFAEGAPAHHHLVFKTHPLEDGREPLGRLIRRISRARGLSGRVHLVRGARLAPLLDAATSAVTVNSTAGQQALWRGLPLLAMGRAIYSHPGLASEQSPRAFFADPAPPDAESYAIFRRFLLATSQITGSFYSARGRQMLLRRLPDLMLRPQAAALGAGEGADPGRQSAAGMQHLRLVG